MSQNATLARSPLSLYPELSAVGFLRKFQPRPKSEEVNGPARCRFGCWRKYPVKVRWILRKFTASERLRIQRAEERLGHSVECASVRSIMPLKHKHKSVCTD